MIPASLTIVLMAVSSLLIVANRNVIERKRFFSLAFFAVPPFAAIVLQVIFYGISVMLNGLAISLFIVFITIQNRRMDTDYLTGIYNRKRLESYLKTKISRSSENRTFSAVLIDLNNFKSINDNFGHNAGDEALAISVSLIKSCIGSNDFLARYGGDEFCIVLDVSNKDELEQIIVRINSCIEKYNESAVREYPLGFSMGYAVYDFHAHMTAEAFQKQIDILMYQNKRTNKAAFRYF
jgi:diguanylate cyclase (GGDEF)-like protein